MIRCTVCQTENDEYATTCIRCRGFLQNRILNLDFFQTAWSVIESPRKAFHDVTLAEHKNYSLVLFSLLGISLSFTGFWYYRAGERFDSLLTLIVWGILGGVVLGLVLAPLISLVHFVAARILRGKSGYRNSLGVVAYSLTPVVLSLIFILPVELLTFGIYLFTSNPSPYTIKPASFVTLVGFDILVGLWAIQLAVLGTVVSHRLSYIRSVIVVVFTLGAVLGLLAFLGEGLQRMM